MTAHERLLTTPEAARRLGVQAQTLRVWRCKGKGPRYIRRGDGITARVVYREADIEWWLAARTFDPGA